LTRFRTPLLWLLAAATAGALSAWQFSQATDFSLHDTYYVIVRAHYALSLAAAFLVFALIYGVLTWAGRAYSQRLSWVQLGLMWIGSALIFAPSIVLNAMPLPERGVDAVNAFAFWNWFPTFGYLLTLGSLVVFVFVVAGALRHRHTPADSAIET
jgi:cytochrome c oxidase subunit 1